jgi:taurine dioxygenase
VETLKKGEDTAMKITPLAPLGASIEGIDLAGDIDAATARTIDDAWLAHQVLVFRDQALSQDDQLRFSARFGKVGIPLVTMPEAGPDGNPIQPGIMWVTNLRREDGSSYAQPHEGQMWFHSDMCYVETPHKATLLYAVELPARGGATVFADMYAAYDDLPEATKRRLDGRGALQVHEYRRTERPSAVDETTDALHFTHPAVITHPETGRKALYVNRLMTVRIDGLDADESAALLEDLFDRSEDPANVYAHEWRLGDLVMWDNRCVVHGRADFPETERRVLRRTTVEGARPH